MSDATDYHGVALKLLGLMVDTDLALDSAIDSLLVKSRPKITIILRARHCHSVPNRNAQFKIHIWGLMKANIGGMFYATSIRPPKIEHEYVRFLRELGISVEYVFEEFNSAPPKFRRNIGILGLWHEHVLGLRHPSFRCLLV
jgi:hypothetical protein